ncbi:hypothetical protein E5D57_003585 [Metarhizium anisopliae]|nr:hypothetical protein E5D57_003585 [Metarhizium anisopliae]
MGAKTTPNIIEGKGKMVSWTGCNSAVIARRNKNGLETVQELPSEGQGVLQSGLVLYCTGDNGKLKEAV